MLLYTGMRLSELCALQWKDIEDDIITIRRAFAHGEYGKIEKAPKSNKSRTIPITPDLRELLSTIPRKSKYVLAHDDGSPIDKDYAGFLYRRFFIENNIPYLSPHKCRHSYATYLITSGVSVYDVQSLLGHASVSTTEIYAHHVSERVIEAGKKLKFQ